MIARGIEHRAKKLKVQVREIGGRGARFSCDETFSRPPGPRIACNIRDTRDRGTRARGTRDIAFPPDLGLVSFCFVSFRFFPFATPRSRTHHARSRHHAITPLKADRCNMHFRTVGLSEVRAARPVRSTRLDSTRRKSSRGENKRKRCTGAMSTFGERSLAFAAF